MDAGVSLSRAGRSRPARRLLAYGTIIATIVWLLLATRDVHWASMAGGVMWFARRPSRRLAATVHLLVLAVLGFVTALFFDPGGGMVKRWERTRPFPKDGDLEFGLGQHTNPWVGTGFESFWLGPRMQTWNALPNFPIT